MKAILVIDLPDGTNVDDIKVLYKLFDISSFRELYYSTEEHWNGCSLKPMPQEKDDLRYLHSYTMGWNECLKEILGEQE